MTETYQQYYDYIRKFYEESESSPRISMLQRHFRHSYMTVRNNLDALMAWGWIDKNRIPAYFNCPNCGNVMNCQNNPKCWGCNYQCTGSSQIDIVENFRQEWAKWQGWDEPQPPNRRE